MKLAQTVVAVALAPLLYVSGQKNVVLTNDDGWAVAMIRQQYTALNNAGYKVVLSAPAENQSGTGSLSKNATTLTSPCEFDTCPAGSPPTGSNSTDPRINYINAFPVDAARYGIQTLSPQLLGGPPDLVVSGPNVGNNLGLSAFVSGTIGAATEAALEGIPSIAFSGSSDSVSQTSYTTLSTNSSETQAAVIYGALTVKFVNTLIASGAPFLPAGISINVNYPAVSDTCNSVEAFEFVLSRIFWNPFAKDVTTCGSSHLPTESSVVGTSGCFVSVSVFNANDKLDTNAANQGVVLSKLSSILSCLP